MSMGQISHKMKHGTTVFSLIVACVGSPVRPDVWCLLSGWSAGPQYTAEYCRFGLAARALPGNFSLKQNCHPDTEQWTLGMATFQSAFDCIALNFHWGGSRYYCSLRRSEVANTRILDTRKIARRSIAALKVWVGSLPFIISCSD